jgi:hypothetical protein
MIRACYLTFRSDNLGINFLRIVDHFCGFFGFSFLILMFLMFLSNDQITKTNFLSLLSSFVPFDKHPLDSNLFFPFDTGVKQHINATALHSN